MSILGDLQLIIMAIFWAIVSGVGAWLIAGWRGKRKGKKEAYDEMAEQDRAMADGIRKRKSNRDARGVHPDDIRYRD